MAEFQAYKLEMLSPLHVGERGVGMEKSDETFHSDSLFSALCATIGESQGSEALAGWLQAFLGPRPPFLLSSTFPYGGDLLLFPRPQLRLLGKHFAPVGRADDAKKADMGRRTKDVAFVSPGIFENMVARHSMDDYLGEDAFLMGDRVWLTPAERQALPGDSPVLWERGDPVPRVAIDRVTSRSAIYHVGRVYFQAGCGLYFLVKWNDESWRPRLEEALGYLSHAGVGGERSAGHGQFRVAGPIAVSLAGPAESSRQVTLSLYHPREEEVAGGVLDGASYDLLARRGWMDSPESRTMRRKTVRMLKEGSVVAAGAVGDIVDVTPDGFTAHRVYRNGLAFPVGVEEDSDGN